MKKQAITKNKGKTKGKTKVGVTELSNPKASAATGKGGTISSKLKPHHAKPYRKRHYGSLLAALLLLFVLVWGLSATIAKNTSFVKSARSLVSDIFSPDDNEKESQINSTYGFSLRYNPIKFNASAKDALTGDILIGSELTTDRAYNSIRVSPGVDADNANSVYQSSLDIRYYADLPSQSPTDLASAQSSTVAKENPNFDAKNSSEVKINGVSYLKTEWSSKPGDGVTRSISFKFTSYTTTLEGRPFVIIQRDGAASNENNGGDLSRIIDTLKFSGKQAGLNPVGVKAALSVDDQEDLDLVDRLTFTSQASAEAPSQPSTAEKISTLYSPAVVKIYNVYCMDITMDGQPYIKDACSGATGSGFLIGGDGYVGTNGHVAVNNPLDIAIEDAISKAQSGDKTRLLKLMQLAGVTEQDVNSSSSEKEFIGKVIDKIYSNIPESTFEATNNVDNLLVSIGDKQPDRQELIRLTKNNQKYPEQDSIKQAEVEAYSYRAFDGADGFKESDVAILKINDSNLPSVTLGSISDASQGSEISIMGYPGVAGDNGLVESDQTAATLTSGKVSSIKNASGSDKKLIETDATIGHGNSGGPVFSSDGKVVGIATYTIDGSGDGNGVFNYVRDIDDLKALASSKGINLGQGSETQKQWESGMSYFYQARYSKALKNFAEVERLYPEHPGVKKFKALAEQRIASGEEVKDFPVVLLSIAIGVTLLIMAIITFNIVRHKKRHRMHNELNGGVSYGGDRSNSTGYPVQQDTTSTTIVGNPVASTNSGSMAQSSNSAGVYSDYSSTQSGSNDGSAGNVQ